MNNGDGLTNEQTEKVLQFQDVTGIEDINVSRDVLIRHQWNLEVAIQEQLNIREGRPSMFASSSTDSNRLPQVVNDRFLQQIFSAHMPGGRNNLSDEVPSGFTGFFRYVVRFVVQLCYSTISSIVMTFVNLVKSDNQIVTDPLGDVVNFITAYNEKYPVHPVFYQGTYAQALNDAKRELKFLLVYLHSEATAYQPDVVSFCSQTLSDPNVIDYINQNMFFWACDVSSPEGYRVSQSVVTRSYPVMVLIGLRANKMVIMGRFEGDCVAEEFVRRLQAVVNENEIWLNQARADRLERSFTQSLRQQQDEAYEESLRADEEKERQKQIEREEIMRAQRAEADERQAEEDRKNAIARMKIDLAETVPTEPTADNADSISVVFKLPNGARVERRFLRTNSLKDVYSYIFCHPSSPDEFEITTNFPKRVLCTKDSLDSTTSCARKTLAEVDIKNREVLFVNDLNA